MPKINVNSRTNWLAISGIVDFADTRLDQYVLTTSNVSYNSIDITTDANIGNNLSVIGDAIINGDLTVKGQATIISTDIVTIKDNIVLINSEELGAGVTSNLSGIEVSRGSLSNYQSVFQESTQLFKIGQIGSLQAVATREDLPLNYGAMVYNPVAMRLDSTQTFSLQMTFNSTENSISSSTGAVIVNNGIGAKGNICIDGYYAFKGTDYTNNIKSNLSNDFLLTVGNNLYLNVNSGNNIHIPANVSTLIGNNISILSDNTLFSIVNSIGNINLTTSTRVNIPINSYIGWDSNNNSIVYDSTNMVLNSSGNFTVNSILHVTNTSNSTSSSLGSIVSSGGIGIINTTDATNSSNGGGFTNAGGASIKKQLYVGDTVTIGDTNTAKTQIANIGVNLNSKSRTISINTNDDLAFNSFEGGIINGSSVVVGKASSVYISDSPSLIGGGILVNSYALYINSGDVYLGDGTISFNGTTPTTSYTTGTLKLTGGLAINLNVNSSSITNGGSFSTAGGIAVGLDAYFGGKLEFGTSNTTVSDNIGVNLRSRNRTITTTSSNNVSFNLFEGGIINTAQNIGVSSTLFITGSPTILGGGILTNSYSLNIDSGNSNFNGKITITDTTSSTSNITGSLQLSGGISINCSTDAINSINGGSITTSGGISSAKSIYAGTGIYTVNGNGNHLNLQTLGLNRFTLGLTNNESTSNIGSDFIINRYSDNGSLIGSVLTITRNSGVTNFNISIASSSNSIGSVVFSGGISIANNTNAVNYTNGGSITSAGGFAFAQDGYINGTLNVNNNLNINGVANFKQTNIDTTNGNLFISGTNGVVANVSGNSSITTTGTLSYSSTGLYTTNSSAGITLNANAASNFTTTTGSLTLSGIGITVNGNSGIINIQNSNPINISTNSSINLITTDTINGVKIATTSLGIPITIGDSLSNTILAGNVTVGGDLTINGSTTTINSTLITVDHIAFVVNNKPTGISDGGFLIRRYQTPNNIADGQVVSDTPKETGIFQNGSSLPKTLVLDETASVINNYYKGWWILITSGTGINQTRRIESYNGTTKIAIIYDNVNTTVYEDGLDLTTAPIIGDTYSLFDIPYAGIYYSANEKEFRFAGVPFEQDSGTFGVPSTFLDLHCAGLQVDNGFTINSFQKVLTTSTQAFEVGTTNTEINFRVDTINGNVFIGNTINTVNSTTGIYLEQLNSVGTVKTYSSIISEINVNSNGTETGNLLLNTSVLGVSTNFIKLNGTETTLDILTKTRFLNTTESTSTTIASCIFSGGISISNTTDAISSSNGGGLTIAGGASIAKKLFIGGEIYSQNSKKVNNSNSFTGTEGSVNINGDLVLYNSTSQTIYFNSAGSNIPTVPNRSIGIKIVLATFPFSLGLKDCALGISSNSLWYTVPETHSHDFYVGYTDNPVLKINLNGIVFPTNQSAIILPSGALRSSVSSIDLYLSNLLLFKKSSGEDLASLSSNGQFTLGITSINITPSNQGKLLNINGTTFTDNITVTSGTTTNFRLSTIGQPTLAATNTNVTTTNAINTYFAGAPISGTNNIITNSFNVYIDQGNSIGTGITNAYSLYIKDSPLGTITNSYALYIDGNNKNHIQGKLTIASSDTVGDINVIESITSGLNVNGEISLYNNTKNTILFNNVGSNIPSVNIRSLGTKLVLLPNVSSSTVDYALGVSSNSMWYSVSDASANHSWYIGISKRLELSNTGLIFTSASGNVQQKMNNDTTGMSLFGGSNSGLGAQIDLYGNDSANTGNLVFTSGGTGNITFYNSVNLQLTVSNSGNISLTSTTDSTGSGDGSIYTPGGMQIDKSVYIGTSLILNFNQPYIYTGDSAGRLNIQANTTGIDSRIRNFTFNGNNTKDNVYEIYGLGTSSSIVNTEYLILGYQNSTTNYVISTKATGTGTVRPLVLQTGTNTDQLILNTNGSTTLNGTLDTQKIIINDTTNAGTDSGSLVVKGGEYITKDLIVNGNITVNGTFSAGVNTNQSITVSGIVNSGAITPVNIKTITNNGEVLLSCAFQLTPVAVNTLTQFTITLPGISTNFINIYDTICNTSGFFNNGTLIVDVSNTRAYPNIGSQTISILFTSGNTIAVHTLNFICRYNV